MSIVRIAAAAASASRDLGATLATAAGLIATARLAEVDLLVLPEAMLGGYLADLTDPAAGGLGAPPALRTDGPEIADLVAAAGPLTVCVGITEQAAPGDDEPVHNTAVCLSGDGVLGVHRKVHRPLREDGFYAAGGSFETVETPVGRLGMSICYDKTFPEAARTQALAGAVVLASLSAWPMSRTDPAERPEDDRQAQTFDLYDRARAAENQVVWVAANQVGSFGALRFLGRAKVVSPGGVILAATGSEAGLAVADVDPVADLDRARRSMFHLRDRQPDAYRLDPAGWAPERVA